jgi:cold-inducible RNA-binding protein
MARSALTQERDMSRKLFVGNLPYETMEQDLETLFGEAGQVETVSVMRDRMTGRARGFAFVEMASDEDAQKAITQLNGHQLGGRALTVNEARPQEVRPAGGFGGAGGGRGHGGQGRGGRRTEPRW